MTHACGKWGRDLFGMMLDEMEVKLKPYKADEITNDFSMKTIKEDKYDFLASVKYGGKKFVATFVCIHTKHYG